MRLLPLLVVAADLGLLVAARHPSPGAAAAYAVALVVVMLIAARWPVAGFALALALGAAGGLGYVALLWTAFRAGRTASPLWWAAVAVGGAGVPVVAALAAPRGAAQHVTTYLVFVVLPLVAGAYLRQHARLLDTLRRHNTELRRSRDLLAEQERLHERLRIARDMHDALGHRLGLVSLRAATLEVGDLPPAQREAIAALAGSTRDAVTELHDVVGALRRGHDPDPPATPGRSSGPGGSDTPGGPGLDDVAALVEESARAGVPVRLDGLDGTWAPDPIVGRVASRVVEEGLTTALRHAPGEPVTVALTREDNTLLISVRNQLAPVPATASPSGGHGLRGLDERVAAAGGVLTARREGTRFRLTAALPIDPAPRPEPLPRVRTLALGAVTAILLFGALPAMMLLGGA